MGNGSASDNVVNVPIVVQPLIFSGPNGAKYDLAPANTTWSGGTTATSLLPGMIVSQDGRGLREAGQLTLTRVNMQYGGELGFKDAGQCDVFDNTTQTLTAATEQYPSAPANTYSWFDPTNSTAGYPGSVSSFWTIEYGHYDMAIDPLYNSSNVGTAGVIDSIYYSGTDTYNSTDGRYWGNWTAQKTTVNNCRTTPPPAGWFTDPNSVPGGLNAVNAIRYRATDPTIVDGLTGSNSQVVRRFFFLTSARSVFNGGPHDGEIIPSGTVLANYIAQWAARADNNVYMDALSPYNPAPEVPTLYGDRVTLVQGQMLLKKNTITVDGKGSGAAAIDTTGTANSGDTVIWQVQPSGTSQSPGATATSVQVTDVLPNYTIYDPICTATITGGTLPALVELNTPSTGQTRLTWNLGTLTYNTVWPTLRICTSTDPTAPAGTALINSATVTSPTIFPASDTHTVNLNQVAQIAIGKYVDAPLDPLNDTQNYTLRARNFSTLVNVKNFRFIEVFPYAGDTNNTAGVSRAPGSNFTGTLTLTGEPTTVFTADPTKPAIAGTFYYTADTPATVNQDWNANTSTWCTYSASTFTLALGTGTCPTSLTAVTAFMFVATPDLAATNVTTGYRSIMDINFTLQATGDRPNEWFANRFTGFTPTIRSGSGPAAPLQMFQSNRVEVSTYAFTVGDWVFIDKNNNNRYDIGDTPAPDGTTVQLYSPGLDGIANNNDDTLLSTTTTTAGRYLFNDLGAISLYVVIPAFEFSPGGHLHHFKVDALSGPINENDNLSQDGIQVPNGNVISSVYNLNYIVNGGIPTGTEPINDNTHNSTLPLRTMDSFTNLTIDFGFIPTYSVGDLVWVDTNRDGIQNSGEPGIPGVTMTLTDAAGNPVTDVDGNPVTPIVTDANGLYSFTDLPEGTYTVTVIPPAGYLPTLTGAGTTATDSSIGTVTSTALTENVLNDLTLDFGFVKPMVSVGDFIWKDTNRNGTQDAGEPGIAGVTVTLTDSDGNPVTDVYGNSVEPVVTDANGHYSFINLPEGSYIVTVTPPTGYLTSPTGAGTTATDSSTGSATSVALTGNGSSDLTLDFGFYMPTPGLSLVKYDVTSGLVEGDRNDADHALVITSDTTEIAFKITNTGDSLLTDVTLTDATTSGTGIITNLVCPAEISDGLSVGETVICTGTLSGVTAETIHSNEATVTAKTITGEHLTRSDPWFGTVTPITTGLTLVKYDTASGVTDGDRNNKEGALNLSDTTSTEISFKITNTGNSPLTDVTLTDVTTSGTGTVTNITCPDEIKDGLSAGETVVCTGTLSGVEAGSTHVDEATVTAKTVTGETLTTKDPWFGSKPGVVIDSGNVLTSVNWLLVLGGGLLGCLGGYVGYRISSKKRREN